MRKYKYSFSINTTNGFEDTTYSIFMKCWEINEQGDFIRDVKSESKYNVTIEQCLLLIQTFQIN